MQAEIIHNTKPSHRNAGFSILELLVVIAIIGILAGVIASSLRLLQKPALSDARAISAAIKVARSKAIGTTSAVQAIFNTSTRTLNLQQGTNCSATTWSNFPGTYNITLNSQVETVSATSPIAFRVCFNSRGLASNTAILKIKDARSPTYTISIFLGGAVEVTQ
ncbi:pilus assembly FimT family protein [Deinococcus hopiensis]|uniref:pilus assembly FimT family protein n=1 Tax=Deinococcus hopiensis TaxID=309885 RepID=UPI000A01AD69|nr:prepilin-type N-terminal cleavage/methylation domain-containing protein [Deinococcus hopiensis]